MESKINLSDLATELYRSGDFTLQQCKIFSKIIVDAMILALENHEKITIKNFGTFYIKQYNSPNKINPRTKEIITTKPKAYIRFKPSSNILEQKNTIENPIFDLKF